MYVPILPIPGHFGYVLTEVCCRPGPRGLVWCVCRLTYLLYYYNIYFYTSHFSALSCFCVNLSLIRSVRPFSRQEKVMMVIQSMLLAMAVITLSLAACANAEFAVDVGS